MHEGRSCLLIYPLTPIQSVPTPAPKYMEGRRTDSWACWEQAQPYLTILNLLQEREEEWTELDQNQHRFMPCHRLRVVPQPLSSSCACGRAVPFSSHFQRMGMKKNCYWQGPCSFCFPRQCALPSLFSSIQLYQGLGRRHYCLSCHLL